MRRWTRILRTFLSGFALPFISLGMILSEIFTKPSDMTCIAMGTEGCQMLSDSDCSKCSFYEPKVAYPLIAGND